MGSLRTVMARSTGTGMNAVYRRDLAASSVTMAIYGAMIAAALLRIGAGVLPHAYMVVIGAAGAVWIALFLLASSRSLPDAALARAGRQAEQPCGDISHYEFDLAQSPAGHSPI